MRHNYGYLRIVKPIANKYHITRIHSWRQCVNIGHGGGWCITDSRDTFNSYERDGFLWIIQKPKKNKLKPWCCVYARHSRSDLDKYSFEIALSGNKHLQAWELAQKEPELEHWLKSIHADTKEPHTRQVKINDGTSEYERTQFGALASSLGARITRARDSIYESAFYGGGNQTVITIGKLLELTTDALLNIVYSNHGGLNQCTIHEVESDRVWDIINCTIERHARDFSVYHTPAEDLTPRDITCKLRLSHTTAENESIECDLEITGDNGVTRHVIRGSAPHTNRFIA